MSEVVTLKSFPFDSMETDGVYDREYEAKVFRDYFAKFLSTGVYFGTYKNYGENSLKVILDGNLSVKVLKGCGIIEGTDFELENDKVLTFVRPESGTRKDRIVIKVDNTLATRATQLYIKEGNGTVATALQRDDNIYEICIAEVTVKATANLTNVDVVDTRLNKDLCGIVNSLITVDGEELYQKFVAYIDTVTEELVRKDQNIVLTGTIKDSQGRGLSTNDFTNTYKSKLDSLSNTVIENTLTSTSTVRALSAAMGKDLNDKKQAKIKYGKSIPTSLANGEIYLQYFD